jgi:hypothetical protein
MPHSPGRPRVLDDVKRGQISAIIAAGCGLAAAARYVGCSVDTIRREAIRNDAFRHELRGAEVRSQLDPLQAMRTAAKSHWRAAAWLLERTNPEQFDRRRAGDCKPQELHKVVEAVVESAVEEIADPEIRERVCRRLLAVAYRSSRALTAVERARLEPPAGPFDLPTTAEQSALDKLLAEVEAARLSALRNAKRENQNPPKCA